MKHFTWFILSLSFIMIGCESERAGNAISLIAELPDTAEYAIDGNFVDIGIVYNIVDLEGVSVYNYNKRWCLFSGKSYWVMDKAKLDEIATEVGIILPSNLDLPFWDEWGGRIIAVSVILLVILGFIIWSKIQPKQKVLKPFNTSLNKHNAANLIFDGHYKIKKYNGAKVRWSTFLAKTVSILLPPGECSLIFNFAESDGQTKHTANNHDTKNNVEAGKTYFLKSYRNDLSVKPILATYIVEGKDNDEKYYGLNTGVWKASWCIKRVGSNITQDNARQFVNDLVQKLKDEGYNFVDERGDNAGRLYSEYSKFPVTMLKGEVYTYKDGIWLLLISRGDDLGIMWSFKKN